jgi:hypothetical protein
VLHRDLKPANVMLQGGGHPVLLDFGLGGRVQPIAGAVTQQLYGTVAYLAPEQIENDRVGNDPRTDVYQMGLVLYEFMTRHRAFPGHDSYRTMTDIRLGRFATPRTIDPEVPPELEDIALQALEYSSVRRYSDAGALREDLERFVAGALPAAARGRSGRSLRRRVRHFLRRYRIAVLVGLVALATFALSSLLMEGPRDAIEVLTSGPVIKARLTTERPRHVFAYLIEGDGPAQRLRLLAPRGGALDGRSVAVEPGSAELLFEVEDGAPLEPDAKLFFLTCNDEKRQTVAAAFTGLEDEMAQSGSASLPLAQAQGVLDALAHKPRAAGAEPLPELRLGEPSADPDIELLAPRRP